MSDDVPAVFASARPHVHQIVSAADRVLVMFDHDYGIAQVAQLTEGAQQPVIVALMQSDRGFVENIKHAGQAGADLAGKADTLRFAA